MDWLCLTAGKLNFLGPSHSLKKVWCPLSFKLDVLTQTKPNTTLMGRIFYKVLPLNSNSVVSEIMSKNTLHVPNQQ